MKWLLQIQNWMEQYKGAPMMLPVYISGKFSVLILLISIVINLLWMNEWMNEWKQTPVVSLVLRQSREL